ncbi:isochorismate synthase [Aquimarina sp. 2304DJ70-9]|uniref:isochorismate synthase n=1 Tax=Aquimarina penaris TaxID=3231044 RepID=UPI003461BB6E
MNEPDVYAKIQQQLDQKLPFVVYNKPGSDVLTMFSQDDDTVYEVGAYSNSGFIFAPFDSSKRAVFFPFNRSTSYNATILDQESIAQGQSTNISGATEDSIEKNMHLELVKSGVKTIESGGVKKVVLSRKEIITNDEAFDPLAMFQRLIKKYSKAFVYLWFHPRVGMWLGATPETLLQSKDHTFNTMALAGTQPYKTDETTVWADKEIEEQEMVTDFILKELSPVANDIVSSKTYTHRAGTLLHLRTDIKGKLNSYPSGIEDVVKILHPTPAVCGVPKGKAKSFILKHEGYDRKFYTGFLGELNIQNDKGVVSNLFVNLRCMELKGKEAYLYVGGGITKDSDPEKEWEETVRKTETMKNVLF